VLDPNFATASLFETSRELSLVRYSHDYNFESKFSKGMELYIEGNFESAKETLEECLSIKPRDGPSLTLIDYMGDFGYKAPSDWEGYRVLSDK
jgi:hypothetical protein